MKRVVLILCVCVLGAIAQADLVSQPYIAGEFNGWDAGAITMNDLGGGIWGYTIIGTPGAYQQFKVTDGTWDNTAPSSNSWYTIPASGEVNITFNTNIVSDGWLPEQFRVSVNTDPGVWSVVGDFNGWNNNDPAQAMTDLGDGIYMKSQVFAAGSYLIKAVNSGSWDGIGPDGRSADAWNYDLVLEEAEEVTLYINAFAGTIAVGDDIDLSFLTKAYAPDPADGQVVGSSLAELGWSNPDPNNPADSTTCDVYFLDAGTMPLTEDPNMGPDVTDPGVVQIADDITDESVVLPVSVLPLLDDHYYYWAVHCTDPAGDPNGNPETTPGNTWYFFTGDAAPVPGQPVDQYMWLTQDDSAVPGGDGPSNIRYFEVTATYTDDDKSPVVDANFVNLNWDWANGELGIEEVSDVHDPGTKTVTAVYRTIYEEGGDPNNTTVLPGFWQIRLEVTDGTGTAIGTAGVHEIFETCEEASVADPTDDYDGHYDANGDCIVNMVDFADFAAAWLYQGFKYE